MKIKHTAEELQQIADRQLARIRRGEPMVTVEHLASRAQPQPKEGAGAPYRLSDVSR
jgi:predicted P-loop ATPase/GTPase